MYSELMQVFHLHFHLRSITKRAEPSPHLRWASHFAEFGEEPVVLDGKYCRKRSKRRRRKHHIIKGHVTELSDCACEYSGATYEINRTTSSRYQYRHYIESLQVESSDERAGAREKSKHSIRKRSKELL